MLVEKLGTTSSDSFVLDMCFIAALCLCTNRFLDNTHTTQDLFSSRRRSLEQGRDLSCSLTRSDCLYSSVNRQHIFNTRYFVFGVPLWFYHLDIQTGQLLTI